MSQVELDAQLSEAKRLLLEATTSLESSSEVGAPARSQALLRAVPRCFRFALCAACLATHAASRMSLTSHACL